jgi:hypothetical protein
VGVFPRQLIGGAAQQFLNAQKPDSPYASTVLGPVSFVLGEIVDVADADGIALYCIGLHCIVLNGKQGSPDCGCGGCGR